MHTHHHAHHPLGTRRSRGRSAGAGLATGLLLAAGAAVPAPAVAVNADHGQQVVSDDPVNVTPHVMNGSVNAVTQIGNKIIAAGTFTSVSPASTFTSTGDDLVRNRIFAFDATTGAIDTAFNPNLGGAVNSLDTDGTHVYVGGSFGSVGGNSAIRRVVKLTAGGAVVGSFNAVPDGGVNEVVVRGLAPLRRRQLLQHPLGRDDDATQPAGRARRLDRGRVVQPRRPVHGRLRPRQRRWGRHGHQAVRRQRRRQPPRRRGQLRHGRRPAAGADRDARHQRSECDGRVVDDQPVRPGAQQLRRRVRHVHARRRLRPRRQLVRRQHHRRVRRRCVERHPVRHDHALGDVVVGQRPHVGQLQRWGHALRRRDHRQRRLRRRPPALVQQLFQGDQAGPGAVPREGIAALDPVNGLPLSWNPGRARGVGAQALHATAQGLWVGSDTNSLGGERHARIAFLPLAGGTTVPAVAAARLPNDLFLAERTDGPGALLRRSVDATGAPTAAATPANTAIDWSRCGEASWSTAPSTTACPTGASTAARSTRPRARWGPSRP